MGASRLNEALDRIDRALVRIESAAEARPQSAAADPQAEEAHRSIRFKVEEAIARLDGLIASAEQG